MKALLLTAVFSTLVLFSGCTSVPLASDAAEHEAKQFLPIKDKSVFYIYRNEFFGGAVGMEIYFDHANLGGTNAKHFMRVIATPGSHIIASQGENRDSLTIKSEPGKIYYIWQEAKMGVISARTKLNLVNETEGKRGVYQCSLVDHLQPE